MKRWAIAGVVVVGVVLGVLLMPRPDTGGDVGDRAGAKLDGPGFVAPADNDPRAAGGTAAPEPAHVQENRLSQEEREAITAKLSTSEANVARLVSPGWSLVRMGLSGYENEPEAVGYLKELEAIDEELRKFRRASTPEGWDALEAKQQDLLARIKASPYGSNGTLQNGVEKIETTMQQYNDGTLPIKMIGPAAEGSGIPAVVAPENMKHRPR